MPNSDIKVTEIYYNPSNDVGLNLQYVEVVNTGTSAINMANWAIGNSDFIPEGFVDENVPALAAGGVGILVNQSVTRAQFEAAFGPLPAGAVLIPVFAFFGADGGGLGFEDYPSTLSLLDDQGEAVAYLYKPDIADSTPGNELSVGYVYGDGDPVAVTQTASPGVSPFDVIEPPAGEGDPTEGDDNLKGDQRMNTIALLGGNDTYDAGAGADSVSGGDGNDNIAGGYGNDTLNGDAGDDTINGDTGRDIIDGGDGSDEIYGGNQVDTINGGADDDDIYGGAANDILAGDAGNDTINGDSGNDSIDGGDGMDIIFGGHGNDRITGGSGDDLIFGGKSHDIIRGQSGNDVLHGDDGQDRLYGGGNNDFLYGGKQSDILNGGNGDDTLDGGRGHDELTGGNGADTFVFAGTMNDDTITDFDGTEDLIDLSAFGTFADLEVYGGLSQNGADAVIDLGGDGSITLTGVNAADLTLDMFIFADEIITVG
ncbi:lamin tail domain-containing protein [Octadecabacter sp. R77987]|uniref:lamin tail domain-containing protein n=1 Tax=Octadecabacter sp. R77987 TaxID=3093874 RepID=UPI00366EF520